MVVKEEKLVRFHVEDLVVSLFFSASIKLTIGSGEKVDLKATR